MGVPALATGALENELSFIFALPAKYDECPS